MEPDDAAAGPEAGTRPDDGRGGGSPGTASLVGIGATAFAVFLVELALMRAIAQVTWPPFAFLALSAAMLGGGVAGTALALRPRWARHHDAPAAGVALVAVGGPLAMLAALRAGLEPLRVGVGVGMGGDGVDGSATALFVAVLAVLALPFVGLAVTVSALLVRHPGHGNRLYGADLVGAALGAFASVVVLDTLGTAGTATAAGVVALAALPLVALDRPRRIGAARSKIAVVGAALVVVVLVIVVVAVGRGVPQATLDKRVGPAPARDVLHELAARGRLHTVDGADGRVDVLPAQDAPVMLVDLGAAVTRAPTGFAGPPPRDAAGAAFLARSAVDGDVLVVGAGAGYEVARALQHGARHVDAVEVAGTVVTAATDGSIPVSRALYADPRVRLHHDEARAFLERRRRDPSAPRRWRHVVAVHTITNAAVTAHAMQLAEDFLLTRQALRALVEVVDDDGVLYLTRPQNQIAVLAELARRALRDVSAGCAAGCVDNDNDDDDGDDGDGAGAGSSDVEAHLALLVREVDDPFFRGLLVSRRPLDRGALVAPPGHRWVAPPAPLPAAALPTDDRPFFHRHADDVDAGQAARLRIEGRGLAERALLQAGGLSALVALLAIVAPLRRRRADDEGTPAARHLLVAALLGLGFMVFELSLAQRLTLFAGRPVTAFAAVVGGILLGAGGVGVVLGPRRAPPLSSVLGASALAIAASTLAPSLLHVVGVLGWPAPGRALALVVVAAATAAPLGLALPALLADSARRAPTGAPWLYGVNAAVGVGAAAAHGLLAPILGLTGTTLAAAAAYAAGAVVVFAGAARRHGE